MLEKKYSLSFGNMKYTIFDPTRSEVMSITMKDKSFPVEWKQSVKHAFSCVTEKSMLWHKRLGHFASAAETDEVCSACQLGKQKRLSFPKTATSRATEKLQLITPMCVDQ